MHRRGTGRSLRKKNTKGVPIPSNGKFTHPIHLQLAYVANNAPTEGPMILPIAMGMAIKPRYFERSSSVVMSARMTSASTSIPPPPKP